MNSVRRFSSLFSKILCEIRNALVVEGRAGAKDVATINWETLPALEFMPAGLGYSFDPHANTPRGPSRDSVELSTMSSTTSAGSEYDSIKQPLLASGRASAPKSPNGKRGVSLRRARVAVY